MGSDAARTGEFGGPARQQEFPELGFYLLPGDALDAKDAVAEVRAAEAMGLGGAFVGERPNRKEAGAVCGAAAAVTDSIGITLGVTNINIRHPAYTAGLALTVQSLAGGRFTMGFGRGVAIAQEILGLKLVTTAELESFAVMMRRLFRGEIISNYDAPTGNVPILLLDQGLDEHLPLALGAMGPKTLALGGRCFDDVILHPFYSDETLVRSVDAAKTAAEQAGRDPGEVKVWSCFVVVSDEVPYEPRLRKTVGRLATYLQYYGDVLVGVNRWDPDVLAQFRADSVVSGFLAPIDGTATVAQLEHIGTLLPDEWMAAMGAGTPAECAAAVRRQIDVGADAVLMHGATPSELEPVIDAYRQIAAAG